MANEAGFADHLLTTRKLVNARKLVHGPQNSWLSKRRDGASNRWMITWYDPSTRNIRYRSTKTANLRDAKATLAAFQLPDGAHSLPPHTNRRSTMIYFIGGDTGAIKIGRARDPERRLASLQIGSPIPLRILAMGVGSSREERILHGRFAAYRLHGEWFERCPEILAEIDRLNGGAA